MARSFSTQRRVEFCETDAAGIAHFSSLLCYMEQAEHALLRSLGASVVQEAGQGWHLSWPRVHVECDFHGTARFEDVLEIEVRVLRLGSKSVSYGFRFLRGVQPIATGKTIAVCCRVKGGEALESVAIPGDLHAKLSEFVHAG